MSRDIFVQDLPVGAYGVADIPDDWMPQSLPFGGDFVVATLSELVPSADFTDPTLGHISLPGVDIEVSLGDEDPLHSFALHVRASDAAAADILIARVLQALGVRAFDPEGAPESGIFGNG